MPAYHEETMFRATVLLFAAYLCVAGCESADTPDTASPSIGAAHNGAENTRLVSIYLQSEPNNGFIPVYADRVVIAEPVIVVPKMRAEGRAVVQDVNTIILGSTCSDLYRKYPALSDCDEVETIEFEYGEAESTTTTDTEGFSALMLGQHDKYRVSIQSWVTAEDDKCYWGGSEILENDDSTLGVPVLVFCE